VVKNAMMCDFSWKKSSERYIQLYQKLSGKWKLFLDAVPNVWYESRRIICFAVLSYSFKSQGGHFIHKFSFKSFAIGLIAGLVGVSTVTAAGLIQSAKFRDTKITVNGLPIELNNQLAGIINDTEPNMKLYMPLRELLLS
jgi:hypothetical protein